MQSVDIYATWILLGLIYFLGIGFAVKIIKPKTAREESLLVYFWVIILPYHLVKRLLRWIKLN